MNWWIDPDERRRRWENRLIFDYASPSSPDENFSFYSDNEIVSLNSSFSLQEQQFEPSDVSIQSDSNSSVVFNEMFYETDDTISMNGTDSELTSGIEDDISSSNVTSPSYRMMNSTSGFEDDYNTVNLYI